MEYLKSSRVFSGQSAFPTAVCRAPCAVMNICSGGEAHGRTRAEIKNLNSFPSCRQLGMSLTGGQVFRSRQPVFQKHGDSVSGKTLNMREKRR